MRKLRLFLILATAIFLLASACAPAALAPTPTPVPAKKEAVPTPTAVPKPAAAPEPTPAAPKPAPIKVKMSSVTGSLVDAGIYIAWAKGYFAEQGLEVENIPFKSATEAIGPLTTGELDISGGGWSIGFVNAIQRGIPLKVVADKMSKQAGFTGYRINIRKDLYDSGQITKVADLKGKKVAVTSAASMAALLAPSLKEANLTAKDIDMVAITFADMVAALRNKAVDAAVLTEPLLSKAVEDGLAVRGKDLFDVDPAPSAGVVLFPPKFAENAEAANRFMIAYVKALRDYNDAFLKGKGKKEIVDILAKYSGVVGDYDKMDIVGFNPDGYADRRALEWAMQYWLSTGELKEKLDLDKVVDNSYVENALQKLGKYAR